MAMDEEPDHYFEGPYRVFTAAHHLRRGSCCGNGCRHCPFEPRAVKGCTGVADPGTAARS